MRKELTEKQSAMLTAIKDHIAEHGFPPTVRHLQELFDFASVNAVYQTMQALEKKKYIRRVEKGRARGLEVVGWRPGHEETGVTLPLIGRIAAGPAIAAYEDVEEHILVDPEVVGSAGDFALQVQGDSMIEAGIQDGDIIIVQRTEQCRNGEIVVALLGEDATVKRFFKEKSNYRLQPENSAMDPIIVAADDPDFRLVGRVNALIRRY